MANSSIVGEKTQVVIPQSAESVQSRPPLETRFLFDALEKGFDSSERTKNTIGRKIIGTTLWVAYAGLAIGVLMVIWSAVTLFSRFLER